MDVDDRGVHAAERLIHSVTAHDTAVALDAVRASGDVPTGPGSPNPHRRTLVVAAVLLALVVAGGILLLGRGDDTIESVDTGTSITSVTSVMAQTTPSPATTAAPTNPAPSTAPPSGSERLLQCATDDRAATIYEWADTASTTVPAASIGELLERFAPTGTVGVVSAVGTVRADAIVDAGGSALVPIDVAGRIQAVLTLVRVDGGWHVNDEVRCEPIEQ